MAEKRVINLYKFRYNLCIKYIFFSETYCDDKNTYALYPHPYESCNGVIYCYVGGPRVYKINCGAGYCYDTTKTNCVKMDNTSDGVSSVITETTTTGAQTTKSTTESGSI